MRNLYMATLAMADKWPGKLLDEIDRQNGQEDTLIIFTLDHGHMLGDHERIGKNNFHAWNEMAQIPLFAHLPKDEHAGERIGALVDKAILQSWKFIPKWGMAFSILLRIGAVISLRLADCFCFQKKGQGDIQSL